MFSGKSWNMQVHEYPEQNDPRRVRNHRGAARVSAIRDIEIDDLLRRGLLKTDIDSLRDKLKRTRVLVTGAGGLDRL